MSQEKNVEGHVINPARCLPSLYRFTHPKHLPIPSYSSYSPYVTFRSLLLFNSAYLDQKSTLSNLIYRHQHPLGTPFLIQPQNPPYCGPNITETEPRISHWFERRGLCVFNTTGKETPPIRFFSLIHQYDTTLGSYCRICALAQFYQPTERRV